eukprot:TRINITY_DN97556_c0_g1_i1.p1 TRINITY_DN97556_c0_g1~~TRINITY_DN97556_c0_g1_i1.p1  ORF type:complete len:291 (+),score=78.46 TRINITY_DN97556_c0_g1_i1:83-955(+)
MGKLGSLLGKAKGAAGKLGGKFGKLKGMMGMGDAPEDPPVGRAWQQPPDELPLYPPPVTPQFEAQPATRATAMAQEAERLASAAATAARNAERAYQDAEWELSKAREEEGHAAANRKAAVDWDLVDSMTRSLNRLLEKTQEPDGGDPIEVVKARKMQKDAWSTTKSGRRILKAFDFLGEKEEEVEEAIPQGLLADLRKAEAELEDQQAQAEKVLESAQQHRDTMMQMFTDASKKTRIIRGGLKLPRELEKPNGDPWWPEPVPPPKLPERQIMVLPTGAGRKAFSATPDFL